jgi:hypothetical protein
LESFESDALTDDAATFVVTDLKPVYTNCESGVDDGDLTKLWTLSVKCLAEIEPALLLELMLVLVLVLVPELATNAEFDGWNRTGLFERDRELNGTAEEAFDVPDD